MQRHGRSSRSWRWVGAGALCGAVLGAAGASAAPANVAALLDAQGSSVEARQQAVQDLRGRQLSEPEVATLHAYLLTPGAEDGSTEYGRKDAVLKELERQRDPREMVDILAQMYADRQQHPIMRDFAVQHLPVAYEKGQPAERQRVLALLKEALAEKDSQMAGTALLALQRLTEAPVSRSSTGTKAARLDRTAVGAAALQLAADPAVSALTRATALQVCARMGAQAALPLAEELAENGGTVPLRIAAIAAVGDLGGAKQRHLLNQLATGDEPRLRPAAVGALRRLSQARGGQPE